ncbi:MAG: AzlC family ABC transporter permease [Firmicutes bacterium]|nr:AzlC family ABC transporter permease [Bacillota bacterium]
MPAVADILRGVKRGVPIVLGYLPLGLAFGLLAREAGLTPGAVLGMSLLVFAGSAQFMAVAMLRQGAGFIPITTATFFINLRHLLMSAALSPHLRRYGPGRLLALAHQLTDESFALHSAAYQAGLDPSYAEMVALNSTAQAAWTLSTFTGNLLAGLLPNPTALGLDFALPAMFIGLLAGRLTEAGESAVAALAVVVTLVGASVLPGNWNLISAALLAAGLGMLRR